MMILSLYFLSLTLATVSGQYFGNYYCNPGRDVMVQLFEWKWTDIANECAWLAQHNFCAVQVSPPNEHRLVTDPAYPWYQRYQPVSYSMVSRSGNDDQFRTMVTTCNNQGVYIYIDGVFNHMTGGGVGFGSDANTFDGDDLQYPGVPYGPGDFHGADVCFTDDMEIHDYGNANEVRYCRLVGLRDLAGSSGYVQNTIAAFMNTLIGWGVAGFRLDASKHMFPADMAAILGQLNNLNPQWFPGGTRPYIYQEVIDQGGEAISAGEYTFMGRVTEFRHGQNLGNVVRKNNGQKLSSLVNYGEAWTQLNGLDAVVFIDNHDTQRSVSGSILTFFDSTMYKLATAFELAWSYGHVRLMSSYNWPRNIVDGSDQNDWIGPPTSGGGTTNDVACFDGNWICEHRWRQMFNMVGFHNVALGSGIANWWDNGGDAIAFGRGNSAFIVLNNEDYAIDQTLQTGLPAGDYCDVISCDNNRPPCGNSGGACRATITVGGDGTATFNVPNGDDSMIAIHV